MLQRALKMLRAYHHIPQKELAEKLGISNSHLSEIESGKKSPSLELLSKYSDFFKIPTSAILLFSEQINADQKKIDKLRQVVANKILKILEWMHECDEFEKAK